MSLPQVAYSSKMDILTAFGFLVFLTSATRLDVIAPIISKMLMPLKHRLPTLIVTKSYMCIGSAP